MQLKHPMHLFGLATLILEGIEVFPLLYLYEYIDIHSIYDDRIIDKYTYIQCLQCINHVNRTVSK